MSKERVLITGAVGIKNAFWYFAALVYLSKQAQWGILGLTMAAPFERFIAIE